MKKVFNDNTVIAEIDESDYYETTQADFAQSAPENGMVLFHGYGTVKINGEEKNVRATYEQSEEDVSNYALDELSWDVEHFDIID